MRRLWKSLHRDANQNNKGFWIDPEPYCITVCLWSPGLTRLKEDCWSDWHCPLLSPRALCLLVVPNSHLTWHLCLPTVSSEVSTRLFSLLSIQLLPELCLCRKNITSYLQKKNLFEVKMKATPFPPNAGAYIKLCNNLCQLHLRKLLLMNYKQRSTRFLRQD